MNELAIYNAKLIEIKGNIKQLNDIDIETSNIEKIIKALKEELQNKLDECYLKYENSTFLNDAITNIYKDTIKKLDTINESLIKDYQEFYILNQTLLKLKAKEVNATTIDSIVKDTKSLLNKILLSTKYTENNDKFLESSYAFVYKIIKVELIYNNHSILLDHIKTDSVHTSYLTNCIKDDIEDLSKKKQEKITEKILEINKNGFADIYYLNEELILLIIKSNKEKYASLTENSFTKTFDEYKTTKDELERIKENIPLRITEIKNTKLTRHKLGRKNIARKALYFLNLGIVGLSIVSAIKLTDKIPLKKEYKTITTVYDSSNPDNKEENIIYQDSTKNSLTLTEYSPWESPGYFREEYQRNVYKYSISDLAEYSENVEDYLTKNFKNNVTLQSSTVETSKEPPKENYAENKYVIEQIYHNQNEYQEVEDIGTKVLSIILAFTGIGLLDALIVLLYLSHKKDIKDDRLNTKKNLLEQKQLLLEEKNKLNTLTEELNNLKIKVNQQYEKLPEFLKEDEEIQKRIRKLNDD